MLSSWGTLEVAVTRRVAVTRKCLSPGGCQPLPAQGAHSSPQSHQHEPNPALSSPGEGREEQNLPEAFALQSHPNITHRDRHSSPAARCGGRGRTSAVPGVLMNQGAKNPPNSTKPKYQSSPGRIDGITVPSRVSLLPRLTTLE